MTLKVGKNNTYGDFLDHRGIRVPGQILNEGLIRKIQIRSLRPTRDVTLDITVDCILDRYLILSDFTRVIDLVNFNWD